MLNNNNNHHHGKNLNKENSQQRGILDMNDEDF
jgi:hypothetical protein